MANYLSDKTGAEIDASLDKADIAITTSNTGITSNGDMLLNGGNLTRSAHESGHLEGRGNNDFKTSPIYTISSAANPNDADLNDMYGLGFSHTNSSFLNKYAANGAGWGAYVATAGVAKIFLNGSNGSISVDGTYYGSGAELGVVSIGGSKPTDGTDQSITLSPSNGNAYEVSFNFDGTGISTRLRFNNPNGQVGSITTNGTATAYNVSSDERLKEHFEPINDAFDLVKSIVEGGALQYFTFKSDPSTKVPGFVAQRLIACGAGGMVAEGEGSLDLNVEIGTLIQAAVIERTELTEEVTDSNGKLKTVGTGEFTEKVITPEKRVTPCGVDQSKAVPHLMQLCYDQQQQINALLVRLDAANI